MLARLLFLVLAFSSPLLGTSVPSFAALEKIANLKDLTDIVLATASQPYSLEDQNLFFFIRAQHIIGGGYYPLCPWRSMTTSGLYSTPIYDNLKGFSVSKLDPGPEAHKHQFSFEISMQAESKLKAKLCFELAMSLFYGSYSLDDTIKELLLGVFVDRTPAGNYEITLQFLGDTDADIILQLFNAWWPIKNSNLILTRRAGVNLSSAVMNVQQIYPEAIDREECHHTWRLCIGDLLINELPSITILFDFICSFSSRSLYPGLVLWRDGYSEETSQRVSIHLPSGNLDDLSGTLTVFVRALISRLLQAYISESKTFLMLNLVGAKFTDSKSLDLYFHPIVNLNRAVEALQFINYPAATLSFENEYPDLEAIGAISVQVNGVDHPIAMGEDLFGALEPLTELPKTPIKVIFSGEKDLKPYQLRISLDNSSIGVCRNIVYHVLFSLVYVEKKYGKLASKTVEIEPTGKSAVLVVSAYGPKNHVYEVFKPLRRLIYILLAHMNVSNGSNIMVGRPGAKDNFTIDKTAQWDDVSEIRSQRLVYDIYPKGPVNEARLPVIEEKPLGKGKKRAKGRQQAKSRPAQPKRQQPPVAKKPVPNQPAPVEETPVKQRVEPLPMVEATSTSAPPKSKPTSPWSASPWAIPAPAIEPEVKKESPKPIETPKSAPAKKMTKHQKKLAKGVTKKNKAVNSMVFKPSQSQDLIEIKKTGQVDIGPVVPEVPLAPKPLNRSGEKAKEPLILPPFDANGNSWKVILPPGSVEMIAPTETADVVKYFGELFKALPTEFFEKNTLSVVRNRLTRGKLLELITIPIERQDRMFEFIDIFVKTSLKSIEVEKFVVHDSFVVVYVSGLLDYSVRSRLAQQFRKMFRLPHNEFERLRDLTENKPRKHPQVAMSSALIPSKQLKASPPFVYCNKTWEFYYTVDNSWDVFNYKIFLKGTLPDYPYKYLDTFLAALPADYFAKGHGFEVKLADYDPMSLMFTMTDADAKKVKKLLRPHQVMIVRPHFQTKSEVYQTFVRIFAECVENNLPVFKFKVGGLASPTDAFIEIHLRQGATALKAARIRVAIRALGLVPE